jgi:NAD(P)-dependent dehydrogenase (short-subunit alcohol dehydrogenase family)
VAKEDVMTLDDLMFKPGLMEGQRVLITGGGTGLGKVMAEACVALGAVVYICGRRGGVLDSTAADLKAAQNGKVVPIPCDIRSPEAIGDMLDRIWSDGGALTGLVNNAAGNFISRTEDLSPRGFDAIANIVFRGSFLVTLDCGKRWIAEGAPASVLSIVTSWVWSGGPFTVPSAMSKGGLNVMTQSLAVEWGPHRIRFNAIAPGTFPTEGSRARLRPGEARESYINPGNPMGRAGKMPELANLAVFLLSPGAEYVTGQTIAIDGAAHQAGVGGWFPTLRSWTDQQWEEARTTIRAANEKDRLERTAATFD